MAQVGGSEAEKVASVAETYQPVAQVDNMTNPAMQQMTMTPGTSIHFNVYPEYYLYFITMYLV